ncbi:ATP-grasp domain-containing protein [bacterium]|nr:ATP-grasp domain-containing protein [bacterium]
MPFKKVIVINRGEIAARIIKSLNAIGIPSVAIYSEADAGAPYLDEAGESYLVGGPRVQDSYLNQDALLAIIRKTGADAVHPGYGFFAENPVFASRIESMGLCFIGPSARWIEDMSYKDRARELISRNGLPIMAGSRILDGTSADLIAEAHRIGFPVLVKPVAGGGGIGMFVVQDDETLLEKVETARTRASRSFANADVYLEKYLEQPRHIEFQILADKSGQVRHFFERDCSIQRRYQKLIEESPAPFVNREQISAVAENICNVLINMGYDNIGTMEMLKGQDDTFNFLEMNTRLQVEHGVTEAVTGVDLVALQILSAAGRRLNEILPETVSCKGHAIEARVYAEDPDRFLPSIGRLTVFRPPRSDGIRVDTGFKEGLSVTPFYDPLVAKVIAHGESRDQARKSLVDALSHFDIEGIKTNIPALIKVLNHQDFIEGKVHTRLLDQI